MSLPPMEMNHEPWKENETFSFGVPFRCWDSGLPNFNFPLHWHDYYEIAQLRSGVLRVFIKGKEYTAACGSIIVIPQSSVHGFFGTGEKAGIRLFQFLPAAFKEGGRWQMLSVEDIDAVFEQNPLLIPGGRAGLYEKVLPLLDELFDEYLARRTGWPLAVKSGLCRLLLAFLRAPADASNDAAVNQKNEEPEYLSLSPNERMQRVLTLIFENSHKSGLSLNDGAKAAYLSPYYFSRFFRKQTGESFHHYLSTVRISHAEEALAKTDLPVTTIAWDAGFSSLSTFNRLFKAKNHTTPEDYRQKVKKTS
jgi:AraC-like DNA-binding protein